MKITVIISSYKSKKFVKSKVKSIQMQTIYNQCKFKIYNIQNLQNEHEYFRPIINHKNVDYKIISKRLTLYQTWNMAIKEEMDNTQYLVTCNMDDQWHPEYLEATSRFLDTNPKYNIIATKTLISPIPNQIWPFWSHIIGVVVKKPFPQEGLGPSPMWRSELHQKYGLFDERFEALSDSIWWHKMEREGENFTFINRKMCLYHMNPTSLERTCGNRDRLLLGKLLKNGEL